MKQKAADSIRGYIPTLEKVREYVKDIPGMTITRFYDEAAKDKLNKIKKQKHENRKDY